MLRACLALRIEIVTAVRGGPGADFVRSAILACASVPEVAARLPAGDSEAAVRITGDRELRRLNRAFLGEDAVTDVLSFASGGGGHLGDIALSLPTARRQASSFGHPLDSEVALLCVHGFLHLLGWDHVSDAEAEEMNRLTLSALDSIGVVLAPGRLVLQ
jgi:probable rRNA maturation factor